MTLSHTHMNSMPTDPAISGVMDFFCAAGKLPAVGDCAKVSVQSWEIKHWWVTTSVKSALLPHHRKSLFILL